MPKRTSKPDVNEIAFQGLQELLRRDAERDKSKAKKDEPIATDRQSKKPVQKKQRTAA